MFLKGSPDAHESEIFIKRILIQEL